MKDYYALLGIESNATKAEIKKNYRQLATKFHPDKNSATDSAAKFIVITEAYDVLSSRKKRAEYDLNIWEKLKREQNPGNSSRTIVPPRETTRTRRNKAQQKRSIRYHQAISQTQQLWKLTIESFLIIVRYVPHILGVILAVVIINSAANQLSDTFESGIGRGIGICLFIAGLVYAIFRIVQNANEESKKDVEAFSVFYKLPQSQLFTFVISVLVCVLLLFAAIFKAI